MVSRVYVEAEIRQHPRTLLLLKRLRQLPRQAYHPCDWHG